MRNIPLVIVFAILMIASFIVGRSTVPTGTIVLHAGAHLQGPMDLNYICVIIRGAEVADISEVNWSNGTCPPSKPFTLVP